MKKPKNKPNLDILTGRRLGKLHPSLRKAVDDALKPPTPEIYIAIDGVIADFNSSLFTYLGLVKSEVTRLDDPRIVLNYHRIKNDEYFWQYVLPYPDAQHDMNVKAYLCSRPEETLPITEAWLEYFEFTPAPVITCLPDERRDYIPRGAYVLEANQDTALQLTETGVICYLIDRPWNQGFLPQRRVHYIKEFYQKILQP